jgi:bifunctional non-homologous end joining protein LigD
MLYAFDLLYVDGHDITGMPLAERRLMLEDVLKDKNGAIRLSEEVVADGQELFEAVCEHGLEGIVAKHRDKAYRSGRLGDWLKIKCIQREGFGSHPVSTGQLA